MAKLTYKVSYYIFYVLIALILVVLGLFFCVGYNNPVGEYNAPEHTETLLFLMYGMLGVCVIVTVFGSLAQFITGLKDDPKGAMKTLLFVGLFVAVLVVSYSLGSDAPVVQGDGKEFTDATWLKLTDMTLYAIYFLVAVASISTIVNLSGIIKKF
jgi:uncharacterized membrane protein YkvI